MDHLDFVAPVHVGDLLILKASVNRAFPDDDGGRREGDGGGCSGQTLRHVSSAYVTYVAVDLEGNEFRWFLRGLRDRAPEAAV